MPIINTIRLRAPIPASISTTRLLCQASTDLDKFFNKCGCHFLQSSNFSLSIMFCYGVYGCQKIMSNFISITKDLKSYNLKFSTMVTPITRNTKTIFILTFIQNIKNLSKRIFFSVRKSTHVNLV